MFRPKRNQEKGEKKKLSKAALRKSLRIFKYFQPYKFVFALGFLFLLLSSLTSLVFPMFMGKLVDAAKAEFVQNINRIALMLLGIFLANAIFSYFRIYLFAVVTHKSMATLRQATYSHLIRLSMDFFNKRRVGELTSRIASDISLLQDTFTTTLAEFIRQLITIFGGIAFLSYISGKLTLFMLALVPVLVIVAVVFGRFIRRLSKEAQAKVAESNTIVEETLQGISSVKAFTNEAFEFLRYKKSTDDVVAISLKGAKWRGAFASFIIFCLFGAVVAVIWYGAVLVNDPGSGLSIGDLFTFILYSVFVGASIGGIADLYSKIQKAIGATENLMDIMNEETEGIQIDKQAIQHKISGNVAFDDVSFTYPGREDVQVLKHVSFRVKSGEQVAIVGPSGAGKSTLISLLLRFYDPQKGHIMIDGKEASDYALTELRAQMAVVPQDVILFGGTIKENIAYGKPGASDAEIEQAAQQANATEFIESFPDQYETLVGDRGIQLSGGQRQRIAIARAVLKDPAILLLDEATSSLDSESEKLVQEALEKLMKGRTSFVIAHRLATVRNADKIIVLEKGQVKETGTHDELLQIENGRYKQLSKLQFEIKV